MKLRTFGCSFIYGSELESRNHTWPTRIVDRLELQHLNHGIEGAGNLRIMESILTHADSADVCVVNWSWIDRFDFGTVDDEQWHSMVPLTPDEYAKNKEEDLNEWRDRAGISV